MVETEEYLLSLFDKATLKPPRRLNGVVKNGCIHCGAKLIERHVCDDCHCGQGRMIASQSLEDRGRTGSPKPEYNRVENFQKVMDRFQARQNVEIPIAVYNHLKESTSIDISKRELRNTLRDLGYSKYYGDIHLVHHVLTGVPKNDISRFEQDILLDFKRLVRDFKGRNFYNTQYILYVLTRRYGYNFGRDQFFIPKSVKERAIDNLCRSMLREPRVPTLC